MLLDKWKQNFNATPLGNVEPDSDTHFLLEEILQLKDQVQNLQMWLKPNAALQNAAKDKKNPITVLPFYYGRMKKKIMGEILEGNEQDDFINACLNLVLQFYHADAL